MARLLNKLNDTKCRSASKPGRHGDGGGLYLDVKPSGAKSWVFVWTVNVTNDGKTTRRWNEMGLGAYPAVSLATARKFATEHREAVQHGRNPIAERQKEAEPTFGECVEKFLASMESQWRNAKHRAQWRMTLTDYASPMSAMKISTITTDDVLKVLNPIWKSKPETASRLRGRIERVLTFAKGKGWRSGENPATWRGHLQGVLPAPKKLTRGHHAAMPYKEVPGFVVQLRGHEAISARALEFLILTAARSGEVLDSAWDEFDLDAGLWTVPAARMKAGKEHRVPLSGPALAIIKALREVRVSDSDFVFPGHRKGRPLSNMAFAKLMERMKVDGATAHGFRSAFRDWAGDATSFAREVAEQALAHRVGDATEQAYRRSDALEKRRKLMEAWASYLTTARGNNVVRLEKKQGA